MTRWDKRVDSGDWDAIAAEVSEYGGALLPRLITPARPPGCASCTPTTACFARRSIWHPSGTAPGSIDISMPLSRVIERLKQALYPKLLPIARNWWAKLGREAPWPDSLDDWLASCHAAGQTRSTALMLKYGTNDWNALHQDLYGELVFPLQVVINLSDPETDYTGGEFLLVEQRPRAQSRVPQCNFRRDMVMCSRPVIGRCGLAVAGRHLQCAMGFRLFVPANAMPWG